MHCAKRLAPSGPRYVAWHNDCSVDAGRRPCLPISTLRPRQPSSTEHVYLLWSVFGYSHFHGNVLLAGIFILMLLCVHDVMSDWQAGSQVGGCRVHGTLLQIRFMKNKKKCYFIDDLVLCALIHRYIIRPQGREDVS